MNYGEEMFHRNKQEWKKTNLKRRQRHLGVKRSPRTQLKRLSWFVLKSGVICELKPHLKEGYQVYHKNITYKRQL